MLHYIKKVTSLENFYLHVVFRNGETKIFDAQPYLTGPIFEPLLNPFYFEQVQADPISGAIFWPNGADFCPDFVHSLSEAHFQNASALAAATA